ncbi:hypothetical protein N7510_004965 [Penicillium lagena]|uniref:uncharacterized protein n=1 Tax=Penicillium lagena TaxID=94218 RepID=UPI00254203B1|nr:uncharacterized protein N7510_004965 [Penicillium lagena]KAJ5620981.1 hypothetical protein N7510_004965 [Penicillium lagena]
MVTSAIQLLPARRYTVAELVAAVNQTLTIPPLTSTQLLQVLYRCIDIKGSITGNSFCISECLASSNMTMDDQCSITPPTNGTVTVTVTTTVTNPVSPFCFTQCQTFCFGNHDCDLRLAPIAAPATVTLQ